MKTKLIGLALMTSLLCSCDSYFEEPEIPAEKEETSEKETRNAEDHNGISGIVIVIDDGNEEDIDFSL